jgi:phosphoribosyl-ATP pyrophosphohydrolase/phosphoribosyl-AMP cyclohydrolase
MMNINFNKGDGLIPAVIQDSTTMQVLMVGYMNEEAYSKTVSEGRVTFFSRSRQRLWTKGETSGNFLTVVEMLADCDQDALLVRVVPAEEKNIFLRQLRY